MGPLPALYATVPVFLGFSTIALTLDMSKFRKAAVMFYPYPTSHGEHICLN